MNGRIYVRRPRAGKRCIWRRTGRFMFNGTEAQEVFFVYIGYHGYYKSLMEEGY